LATTCDGETVIDVTAVEDAVTFVVVGDACFPLPLEQPTTRKAEAANNAQMENAFSPMVLSMTLAVCSRFPDRGLHMPVPIPEVSVV